MQYFFYGVILCEVAVSLFLVWMGSLFSWRMSVFFGILCAVFFTQHIKEALEFASEIRHEKRRKREEKKAMVKP